MRVCILGAGGLGSVIGGLLAKSGVETVLIARQAHADAVNANGLKMTGVRGEFVVKEHLSAAANVDRIDGEFDYMILGVKSKDTNTILEENASLKGRVATVCSVQNNIVKEGILAEFFGEEAVLGASTIEGATLEGPGHAHNHMTVDTTAYFGELDGTVSPRAQLITDAFNAAGLSTKAVPHIRQVLWEKLTQIGNASTWSVSTLAGNPELGFADGLVVREGAEHFVTVARELLSVYKAQGYEPQNFYAPISRLKEINAIEDYEEAVQMVLKMGQGLKERGTVGRTSMHDDVLRGRKTEAEFIIKPFVEKGAELGIPVPTVTACYRIIRVLDNYLQ